MAKHKDPNMRRTRARAQALQLLFRRDFLEDADTAPADIASVMDDVVFEKYANEIFEGVLEHQAQIDAVIEDASENWSIARMSLTDRSILRIAAFELLYRDDIPSGVSINEAVELAQDFGGEDDSFRFVNGVLGKIAGDVAGADAPADAGEQPEAGQPADEQPPAAGPEDSEA